MIAAQHGAGVSCERIFKIKAVESFRPERDAPGLIAQGFIGFRADQAFYVLAQYPLLEAYFVSNQYAVPFGRSAVCGLVPARFFAVVDLYSSDSTKVPPPTPVNVVPTTYVSANGNATSDFPSPPASAVVSNPNNIPLFRVTRATLEGHHRSPANELSFTVSCIVDMADGSPATSVCSKTYQDFLRFYAALLEKYAGNVPVLPPRPIISPNAIKDPKAMHASISSLQNGLENFLNKVIAAGLADIVTLFLIPPNGSIQVIPLSALPQSHSNTEEGSTSHFVQSPSDDDVSSNSRVHRPSNPAVPPTAASRHNSFATAPRHDSAYSLLSETHRTSLLSNDASNRASFAGAEPRGSLLLSEANRASIASLGLSDSQRASLVASGVGARDSLVDSKHNSLASRHNSVLSRHSNRFSISSRRGSAYVGISIINPAETETTETKADNGDIFSPPPKAPVTQFGANGPVRSSVEDLEPAEPEVEADEEEHEDVKHRRRREMSDATSHRYAELIETAKRAQDDPIAANLVDELAKVHIEGTGRNAVVNVKGGPIQHVPFPERSSSRLVGAAATTGESTAGSNVDHALMAKQAQMINSIFQELEEREEEATGVNDVDKVRDLKKATSSASISGRSSSLGWRQT